VSDVTISPGLDEPELFSPGARPQRRFTRRAFVPPAVRRSAPEITEGAAQGAVNVREGLYRRTLAVADAFAAFVALALVVVWDAGADLEPWVLLAMPVAVFVAKVGGLYERDELVLKKTTLDEAPALLQITGLFALSVFLGQNNFVHAGMTPPLVAELWLASFFAIFLGRVAARRVANSLSRPERCLVLGDAEAVRAVRTKLEDAGVNAKVVASVRLDALAPRVSAERFRSLVCDNDVHRVILAPVTTDARDTLDMVRVAKATGVRVSLLPRLFEVVGSSVEFDHVDGLTMLGVRRFGLTRSSHALKRAFDLFGSTVMLVALAPIMAAVAIAIRLDSRGPILFRQTRIGRDGAPFEIFKFRTMVPDAEALKQELAHLNETDGLFKIAADPRITRVGAFLRRAALDELPQLFNVWRGEMSLVGPRPLVVDEDAKIEGLDRSRLHLTPGMTGHWQILGSARIPLHEMVGIDYLYVANWSLWTDLKILLRTVPYMLARRGM
jgi:exopolysaccharide biosynthesis polyprenyl glycosylphosphotransferase